MDRRRGLSILVVAEPKTARSTARSLAEARPQYQISVAPDANAALAIMDGTCFDLVLMDSELAKKEEVCRGGAAARAGAQGNPAVFLLGHRGVPETEREAARLGAMRVVERNRAGLEDLCRTADLLWEAGRMEQPQETLLRHLVGEDTRGPCCTGGR
jgi:CheY-like chemotaxis protein